MSITEKLGKAGVPGFRSGKKWKMAVAVPVYLFLTIFLLAFISVAISGTPKQTTPQLNDDKEFERVMPEIRLMLASDFKGINDAVQKNDYIGMERYSKQLESDSTNYLNILDKLNVSSPLKNIYDRYYAALEDYQKAGEYDKTSAKFLQLNDVEPSISDLSNGVKYMKLGVVSINEANAHLYPETSKSTPIQTQIATPEPTPVRTPIIIQKSGTGQNVTELFYLQEGLARVTLTYTDKSQYSNNFIVDLLDENGERKDTLANEIGSFSGTKAIRIEKLGMYILDVMAKGYWTIKIEN